MRTETPTARASAVARLRAEFGRARRRFQAKPTAPRWSLGLAVVALAVAAAWAATGTSAPTGVYARNGERFAADDLVTIRRGFDARRVRYRVDDLNRVEVAADQLDDANDILAKLDVGPRSIADIENWPRDVSIWDTQPVRDQKRERAANAKLEAMIRPMDGVVSAHVMIHRPRPRGGARPGTGPAATAFVYLETERDRELSGATVESIQWLIAGAVPEVKHDAVTVFDRKGRQYLDAHDPALGTEAKIRRRREELRQEIVEKLDWLKGSQVSVQLVAAAPVAAPAKPPAPEPPAPAPAAPDEAVGLPPLSVGVNQPLELTPAPEPARVRPEAIAATASAAADAPTAPKARVWVKVPRSFYLRAVRRREPSLDDLQPLVERTKGLIETAVRHVVPPGQLDEPVVISTIPDEPPAPVSLLPAPAASTDARRVPFWWLALGAGVAAAAGGLAAVFVMATRRPASRAVGSGREDHGRYKIDEGSAPGPGPGPSERVRELIRLNPEAAASVLNRWTGQGGTLG